MTPQPSAFVTLRCPGLKSSVRALMGEDVPRITGGYGGWDVVDRPRKRGTVEYAGPDPLRMELEIVLDAWGWDIPRTNVNDDLKDLEDMASPRGENRPPPSIKVDGKAIPRDKSMSWVIDNISWGTSIVGTEGQVLRQTAQLQLIQADIFEHARKLGPTKIRAPRPPARGGRPPYRWKKGDTWARLAQRFMGDSKKAGELARFNKYRLGKNPPVGYIVKVPRHGDS